MNRISIVLLAMAAFSCKNNSSVISAGSQGVIVAHVYWGSQGVGGIKTDVLEINQTKYTDTSGHATYFVAPGTYIVQFYGIQHAGPSIAVVNDTVIVNEGVTDTLNMPDCLPCVSANR
ncbi:MAG TPA: hypothetical protein VKS81_11835 [Bacteroidota bacterium]|nr:hypothetical protein [Bacteroidota bacterium]